MKRKLFSTMLCAFALLLLMGASVEPGSSAALEIEEESTSIAQDEQVLETGIPTGNDESDDAQSQMNGDEQITVDNEENADQSEEVTAEEVVEATPAVDPTFLIDGQPAPEETDRVLKNGVTYVAMGPTVKAIASDAKVSWDGASRMVTVNSQNLVLTAKVGDLYAVANGRYLYTQDGIQMDGDRVIIPLKLLTRAFDAKLSWDGATDTIYVQRGSGAILSGDQFYNQDSLFWLSRVIYAESGNQTMKGKMAVGNVVMNRVNHPAFPNNVHAVLAQRNQFTTYRGGKLANRVPTESCVIAAKLVMDGGVVEETRGALYFDCLRSSWASRNRTFVAQLGAHKFYC